jgi:hypothetical protein
MSATSIRPAVRSKKRSTLVRACHAIKTLAEHVQAMSKRETATKERIVDRQQFDAFRMSEIERRLAVLDGGNNDEVSMRAAFEQLVLARAEAGRVVSIGLTKNGDGRTIIHNV